MRGRWFLRGVKFLIFLAAMVALLGFFVMRLWNRLTPELFGWHMIGFWQAVGLLVLARLLFGGFRRPGWGGGPGRVWRGRMMERWEQMTPEEREKFRQGMRGCGFRRGVPPVAPPSPAPPSAPTASPGA